MKEHKKMAELQTPDSGSITFFHCGIDCEEKCVGCSHETQCQSFGVSEKCARCGWREDCLSCNEEEEI